MGCAGTIGVLIGRMFSEEGVNAEKYLDVRRKDLIFSLMTTHTGVETRK
jgi:hypothetical protein